MRIFVPITGQFHNIGDVLHRRVLVNWLKEVGEIHLYGGSAPESFVQGLKLSPCEYKFYKKLKLWLVEYFISKNDHLVFKPGENKLAIKRLVAETILFSIARFKKNNGKTIRVGIAIDRQQTIFKFFFKAILSHSDKVFWRIKRSKKYFKLGLVCPDLAFYDFEHSYADVEKKYVVISYRFDRPYPPDQWFLAIKSFCEEKNLKLICITQVQTDNERNQEIADQLGCNHAYWEMQYSHLKQEAKIDKIIKQAEMILSDRLHVLIKGSNFCANPVGLLTQNNSKVIDHFEVVGIEDNMFTIDKSDKKEIIQILDDQIQKKGRRINKFINAKADLEIIKNDIIKELK